MLIRKAEPFEFIAVRNFYWDMIDMMQQSEYKPDWQKNVYPSDKYLEEAVKNGEMFIGIEGQTILSAMIVNNSCNEGYSKVLWPISADADQIYMIHALGVHPQFMQTGIASQMVQFVLKLAADQNKKAVRLDVLSKNLPAKKLYLKHGFYHVDTLLMFYEDTGWTDFLLFEHAV